MAVGMAVVVVAALVVDGDRVDFGESRVGGSEPGSLSTMIIRDMRFYLGLGSLEEIIPYALLLIVLIVDGVHNAGVLPRDCLLLDCVLHPLHALPPVYIGIGGPRVIAMSATYRVNHVVVDG
jgi:hypothetical protein